MSGSLSRICKPAPAFCSDVPGIIITSSPDGFPRWLSGKRIRLPMQKTQEMWVRSLGWEDPLEKGMAALSSILAWKIPWTEEPSELQSMGSQRVGRD